MGEKGDMGTAPAPEPGPGAFRWSRGGQGRADFSGLGHERGMHGGGARTALKVGGGMENLLVT
jgi:hypothetical protein